MTMPYTLRHDPITWEGSLDRSYALNMTDFTLEILRSNWLYKALDEITLTILQPAWAKDEWVFTPVDFENLPNGSHSRS